MAKEYDAEYSNLQSQKSSNEAQQEDCKAEIEDLEEKISRLRTAYNTIDDAKESIDQIKGWHSGMPAFYESLWKGSKAQYFYDMCESGALKANYDGYVNNIDAVEDAINWEIHDLKCKTNEKYGILSGLVNAWNSLCTRIRNYFN